MSKEAKEFIKNNHPDPDKFVIEKNLLHNVAIIMQAYADEQNKELKSEVSRMADIIFSEDDKPQLKEALRYEVKDKTETIHQLLKEKQALLDKMEMVYGALTFFGIEEPKASAIIEHLKQLEK